MYETECPYCGECLEVETWEDGYCPNCHNSYKWEEYCTEDYSDCWAELNWGNYDCE